MSKTILDFKFFDMRVSIGASALYGSLLLWLIGIITAVFFTDLTPLDSFIAGLLVTILHWLGEVVHQYGHFLAAKLLGKPMSGVRLWAILGTSLYPKDEGEQLPQIHIRRALGGPAMSLAVLILFGILWLLFAAQGGMLRFLLAWVILEQLLIFFGGALAPIYLPTFATDGGTIWHWWREQAKRSLPSG